MTPNPTSAPAPQEQTARTRRRHLVDAIIEAYQDSDNFSLQDFREAAGEIVAEHERQCAKADRLKLAEEADRLNATKGGFLLLWRDVAAWLREKAQ